MSQRVPQQEKESGDKGRKRSEKKTERGGEEGKMRWLCGRKKREK